MSQPESDDKFLPRVSLSDNSSALYTLSLPQYELIIYMTINYFLIPVTNMLGKLKHQT